MKYGFPGNRQNHATLFSVSLFVVSVFLGACSSTSFIVAVPDKSRVERQKIGDPKWQEYALCTFKLRRRCPDPMAPGTFRKPQEVEDFRQFLEALNNHRQLVDFQQRAKDFIFVEKVSNRVVDATQAESPSPAGPIAYKVHDCWIVLYTEDESGFAAMQLSNARVDQVAVFCRRESTDPAR